MPISELGYRPWQGARVPAGLRWTAITITDIGVAFRSSKLLRRFLVLAWFPLLYFCPVFFAVGYIANPENSIEEGGLLTEIAHELLSREVIAMIRDDPGAFLPGIWTVAFYFFFTYTQSFLAMIVVAIVAPPRIASDLKSKAFLLYFSKPISAWEYLLGKMCVPLAFICAITLVPALVLYGISVALSPNFGAAAATAPIVLRIIMASLVTGIPISLIALLFSSLTKDHRIAAFGWVALWILGELAHVTLAVNFVGSSGSQAPVWSYLASVREVSITATSALFDLEGHVIDLVQRLASGGADAQRFVERAADNFGDFDQIHGAFAQGLRRARPGPSPWLAVAWLFGISVACALVLKRRVSSQVRV